MHLVWYVPHLDIHLNGGSTERSVGSEPTDDARSAEGPSSHSGRASTPRFGRLGGRASGCAPQPGVFTRRHRSGSNSQSVSALIGRWARSLRGPVCPASRCVFSALLTDRWGHFRPGRTHRSVRRAGFALTSCRMQCRRYGNRRPK